MSGGLLVLASASPRRREILETLRIPFEVRASGVDEAAEPGESGWEQAIRLARQKACDVSSAVEGWTLGADTVVVVDEAVLGKPRDDEDAARMLSLLSGRAHEVITGVALAREGRCVETLAVRTRVVFVPLDAGRIRRYVESGEGRDKAGAYAVQGLGSGLVAGIEGSYGNVVGLPAVETVQLLERHGVIAAWP